ncbi:nadh oxidase [Trichoderma arundinaceum]|uniref:Nadh oxidase n=1 Tax=Trichoderma arundinaceum TaxID=490622 RepID=A0A395P0A7_TRIAR|nr:nadh oxidase [Trichoderma arundinaceum]
MPSTRYESSGNVDPAPLGQPLQFYPSGRTAKNRFFKSPMAEMLATWDTKVLENRGIPTDALVELYRRWGEGSHSWGVIITGNIDIQYDHLTEIGDMIIAPTSQTQGERFEKFKALALAAKANGSLIVGQLTHPGRQVSYRVNADAVSASDVQLEPKMGMTFGKPHAASKSEITELINGFVHAAEYLEKAGFDGIELHAAHGYLISQFLSRTTNKRTDEYGVQTVENRLRFVTEIVEAIRGRVSPGFIIGAKLNSVEFQKGGVTTEEAREVCEILEKEGVDYVELSGGTYEDAGLSWTKESTKKREAFFQQFAETVISAMDQNRKMRAVLAGGLRSTEAMLGALKSFDAVALARPAAAEPRLPARILEKNVSGAIRPPEALEYDLGLALFTAKSQLVQITRNQEPMDVSNPTTWDLYSGNLYAWFEKAAADGDKMEVIRAPEFSGKLVPYGTEC